MEKERRGMRQKMEMGTEKGKKKKEEEKIKSQTSSFKKIESGESQGKL